MSKEEVLTKTVKHLFNTIGPEDILKDWKIGNKQITDGEKKLLIAEAITFLNTRLWKVLQDEIKHRANEAMFVKAKTEYDLTAGKLWLYTLDCIKTRLEQISKSK